MRTTPYNHGQFSQYWSDPGGEVIQGRDACAAVWFRIGDTISKYLEEWYLLRDDAKAQEDYEKIIVGMGTPEERWQRDRAGVLHVIELAQQHCDLAMTVPCLRSDEIYQALDEFEDTQDWEVATEQLEKYMEEVRECLGPLSVDPGRSDDWLYNPNS
tara:strand:- start:72 stop:542 length:471 start_codon:yes stop_codon:yes gene_type:complete